MNTHTARMIGIVATLFFGLNAMIPFSAWAQVSTSTSVGQTIDASAGALTMPCSLGSFNLSSVDINAPNPYFSGYYLNPLTPDTDLSTCGGTGVSVQDTRFSGGFILQVTATDYVAVGNPANTIGVEYLSLVTEQVSTSYNEDSTGGTAFSLTPADTLITGSTGDNAQAQVTLPFTFTFYGQNYTDVWICSNGEINFTAGNCNPPPTPLTDRLTDLSPHIMGYFKDLTTDTAIDPTFGVYYVSPSATEARFRWKGAPVSNTSELVEFEIYLRDNGTDDTISFDYGNSSQITDSGTGPIVAVTNGGPLGTPVSSTYTESLSSRHALATDIAFDHATFIPAGFDFTEVKKPNTPAAVANQNGDQANDATYTAFTEDTGNPGTSLAVDLIDATVQEGCSYVPGRVGVYTVYPSYRLNVPQATAAGTYQNTITYTVSDSTIPFGGSC